MRFCLDFVQIYIDYEQMINRIIASSLQKSKKSALILGPRQTGKSTLIRSFKPDLTIDLADQSVFLSHTQEPGLIKDFIERYNPKTVFIDEVQRIPELLNTIQSIIDIKQNIKFYLSGSSARKLKRGGANLLPGRVINYSLGTLTMKELEYRFTPNDLIFGYLPGVYTEKSLTDKKGILSSYSANYVSEEIKAEALVRDLPAFSRFLQASPQMVGQFLDYSKIAKRMKIARHHISRYFEIFEDTMVGYRVFPDHEIIEKYDLIKHPKFYFFDVGVLNGLLSAFQLSNDRAGALCEQVVFQQIFHSAAANRKDLKINSLRTRGGAEVDFWISLAGNKFGIEVKYSEKIIDDDVKHLVHFKKIEKKAIYYLAHFGKKEFRRDDIWCLPFSQVLKELGL